MKSFSKFFIPVLAAGLFAACSDDNNDSPMLPEDGPAEGVNMTISLKLPTTVGGRADETVKNPVGEETGKDFENKINKVLLVLADPTSNAFIAQAVTTTLTPDANTATVTAKSKFNKSVLVNYITEKGQDLTDVNVYAFCNPSAEFESAIATRSRGDKAETWINTANTLTADVLKYSDISASSTGIPMANKEIVKTSLPSITAIESGEYSVAEKAFPLNGTEPISVIRSIARFDYKSGKANDIYPIKIKSVDEDGNITDIENGLQIKLTHMTLVNLSKSYYLLHRVSTDKISTEYTSVDSKVTMCGSYDDTFIADTDWSNKVTSNFLHGYNATSKRFDWPTATALNALNGDDNDDEWNAGSKEEYNGYQIWRYVTENTIPSPAQNQKAGVSTGVVFRGILEATTTTPEALKTALSGTAPIYIYKDGTIFASWDAVKTEALKGENANTAIKAAYDAYTAATDDKKDETLVEHGFTIYRHYDGIGYCTLYYYWNRHVDNNLDGVMGEKEFGVVRNNVYKLSVTEISGLGHTREPGDDPDPIIPDTPDEKSDVHIKVSCKVTPWTVRVNKIKF
ncbi:MAG: Mfa1 family fimbria major subunit [Bacteroides sp.]|nr:Mfa1 family fimbria major subunit [Bacteroides sp.]MCM1390807.1 Mfa1 family fimbria major subunit [Bacteroides sp.]